MREILDILGASWLAERYGLPHIQPVRKPLAGWHGRHVGYLDDRRVPMMTRAIETQWYVFKNPDGLARVLAHEMVHDVQFMRDHHKQTPRSPRHAGHGPDFLEMAARINAVKGADYVTVTSDQNLEHAMQHEQTYRLIAAEIQPGTLIWRVAPKRSHPDMFESGMRVLLVRTRDVEFQRIRRWSDASILWSVVPEQHYDVVRVAYDEAPTAKSVLGMMLLTRPFAEAFAEVGLNL